MEIWPRQEVCFRIESVPSAWPLLHVKETYTHYVYGVLGKRGQGVRKNFRHA